MDCNRNGFLRAVRQSGYIRPARGKVGTGQRIQEVPFRAVATVCHEINFHEARLFVTPGCESPNDDLLFEQAARLGGTQAL